MEEWLRERIKGWLADVERWAANHGITVAEIRALWEEVTPTTPVDTGST